jgi:hypothetical protein
MAEAGAMAMLPRTIPHAFRNPTNKPARALTVFIPGGFDAFVLELSSAGAAGGTSRGRSTGRTFGMQAPKPFVLGGMKSLDSAIKAWTTWLGDAVDELRRKLTPHLDHADTGELRQAAALH